MAKPRTISAAALRLIVRRLDAAAKMVALAQTWVLDDAIAHNFSAKATTDALTQGVEHIEQAKAELLEAGVVDVTVEDDP